MTDDVTEADFADAFVSQLHDAFGRVETEITLHPSGTRCDVLVESPSGIRYALELADSLEWGDPTQAGFYADQLDARPVVAYPAGNAQLDELLSIATSPKVPATILPIRYP